MNRLALAIAAIAMCAHVGCDVEIDDRDENTRSGDWEPLATAEFDVPAGEERYYCIRKFVDEDLLISGFQTLSPPGVHHTVITVGEPSGPDGVRDCTSFDHHFEAFIYEGSSGDDPFELPEGVATKIEAGKQISVNVHILNTTDDRLTGTVGHQIQRVRQSEVDEVGTMLYAGKLDLVIPPGESTHLGDCEVPTDITIFGVLPHMHSFGTHMRVIARSSNVGDVIIHDEEFLFDSNKSLRRVEPVELSTGDVVEVQCSYLNTTNEPLVWGEDSYTAEMCFAGVYVYPISGLSSACARP